MNLLIVNLQIVNLQIVNVNIIIFTLVIMEQITNEINIMIHDFQFKYIDITNKVDKYIDDIVDKCLSKLCCKYKLQKKIYAAKVLFKSSARFSKLDMPKNVHFLKMAF